MTISLINILLVLLVIGLVLYLIRSLPIEPFIQNIAYAIVVIFVIIWLLQVLTGSPPIITIR